MERREFCRNDYCAKLTIFLGEEPLILLSRTPPLILEITELSETFTHTMTTPIELGFSFDIKGIEFISGIWYFNDPGPTTEVACPMPGTYPAYKASDIGPGDITDMYWEGKQLFCFFDKKGIYHNNRGQCSYRVFGGNHYKFFDKQGTLFEHRSKEKLIYEVDCNECCKDTEIVCSSNRFPGYTCYPIPPASDRLLKGSNDIRRFWR